MVYFSIICLSCKYVIHSDSSLPQWLSKTSTISLSQCTERNLPWVFSNEFSCSYDLSNYDFIFSYGASSLPNILDCNNYLPWKLSKRIKNFPNVHILSELILLHLLFFYVGGHLRMPLKYMPCILVVIKLWMDSFIYCKIFVQMKIMYHVLHFSVTWTAHSALRGSENMMLNILDV